MGLPNRPLPRGPLDRASKDLPNGVMGSHMGTNRADKLLIFIIVWKRKLGRNWVGFHPFWKIFFSPDSPRRDPGPDALGVARKPVLMVVFDDFRFSKFSNFS